MLPTMSKLLSCDLIQRPFTFAYYIVGKHMILDAAKQLTSEIPFTFLAWAMQQQEEKWSFTHIFTHLSFKKCRLSVL